MRYASSTYASPKTASIFLCVLLASCGGGGSSAPTAAVSTAGTASTSTSGTTTSTSTATSAATPAATPATAFTAQITAAPDDGASIGSVVRFEIRGSGIENAELLPPDGTTPVLGRFTVSADKSTAVLDFDTMTLPNGTLRLRAIAYDKPAGSADASQIVAMPVRQWRIANATPPAPASIPDASWMPEVMVAYNNLPYVDPAALTTYTQMDDATFTAAVADWPSFESVLRRYVPANVTFDFPTPLGFAGPWASCIQTPHPVAACKEVVFYLQSLMTNKQPR